MVVVQVGEGEVKMSLEISASFPRLGTVATLLKISVALLIVKKYLTLTLPA